MSGWALVVLMVFITVVVIFAWISGFNFGRWYENQQRDRKP